MENNEQNKTAMSQALATEAPEGHTSLADLEKEIDSAVEKVGSGAEGEEKPEGGEEPAADEPPAEEAASEEGAAEEPEEEAPAEEPEGTQGRDEKGKFTRKSPISDSLLERAVKAGIPMGEARQFPTEALLASTVARAESVQKGGNGEAKPTGAAKDGEAKPADHMAAIDAIPDEWNLEVYDEKIVKALQALKGIAKAQAQELVTLRGKESKDFMASQLESVKEFTKGDQSKETAVREKFDMLKAGYKATGKDVSDVTVFKEASQLVLGDAMKAAAEKKKTEAARKRSTQTIARAAGNRVAAKVDPIKQVGDEIDAAFFQS